ncbi:hydantoinase/carbamoylase family amidase [Rubrobacter tropicus]|uniref:Hydantoinase/carbamoylase family amidase n=1 Tax=Rubrobacter tropicus TaxID=2653851 RepID=A0A6G8QCU2_9ACTN|nr:Zn-dependent hydrolase [Rubrobacter tropicus]QIN84263.1 hydantoinase/carbamoylase family amidase [Rubrobacter tropicus]
MVDGGRLWKRLSELAEIGKQEDGGVARLSFTKEERAAKDLVASYMQEAGLSVREDVAGNLFGRREGRDPNVPAVLIGSHVDSVLNGGDFDGPLGVLGGIEVLQTMNEEGVETERPVEVVAFTDEEGARFSLGMIGSRALTGTLSPEDLRHEDRDGVSIEQAMRDAGLDPGKIGDAVRSPDSLAAYLELHIEQGKVLEGENLPVGVVTGIAGPAWLRLSFTGEAGHAGTTPMGARRDALAAAAEVVGVVEEEASATGSTVGTVGQIEARPGGINIIPGGVELSLDLRDIDEAVRDGVEGRIRERAGEVCGRRGVALSFEELQRLPPAPCSEEIRASIAAACEKEGIKPHSLPSGAGHDGMHVAELCPMGMIFVRSKDGISHNPKEWSSREDCEAGCKILYLTVLDLAERA